MRMGRKRARRIMRTNARFLGGNADIDLRIIIADTFLFLETSRR